MEEVDEEKGKAEEERGLTDEAGERGEENEVR